jgi:hypothetical protein
MITFIWVIVHDFKYKRELKYIKNGPTTISRRL